MSNKEYILKCLKDGNVMSDEAIVNKFFRFKFWSPSAITKKGSSLIRVMKRLNQRGIITEVKSMRIDREGKSIIPSAEIFYRIK